MAIGQSVSGTVKSAARVLEVFEFFDRVQRPATVMELSRSLKYPQSSTSVLLKSLVSLGYLEPMPEERRAYRPTARLTLLGAWVEPQLAAGGPVLQLMTDLGAETGDLIILGIPQNGVVRYIHTVPATKPMRLHNAPGTVRPIATSGLGRLFMSAMTDDQVREIVERHNASEEDAARRLSLAAVRRDMAAIRAQGHVVSTDRITPGAGVVAVLLPVTHGGLPLALGIGGWSKTIKEESQAFVQSMRKGIRRHLGAALKVRSAA